MKKSLPVGQAGDGCLEIVDRERLRQNGVGDASQARDVGRPGDGGDGGAELLQLPEKRVAALAPDVHVEEHDVDRALAETCPGLIEGCGLENLIARELEIDPAEKADRGLVVDDEHYAFPTPRHHEAGV